MQQSYTQEDIQHFKILEKEYEDPDPTKYGSNEHIDTNYAWVLKSDKSKTVQEEQVKHWNYIPIYYHQSDWFYDRIVALTLDIANYTGDGYEKKNIAPGVLISHNQVLTSYNPFRSLINSKKFREKTYVLIQLDRLIKMTTNGTLWMHVANNQLIKKNLGKGIFRCEYRPKPNYLLAFNPLPWGFKYRPPDIDIVMGDPCGRILGDRSAKFRTYFTYTHKRIDCGRQIVPLNDRDIADEDWHGGEKRHSPLHDLMVVKMSTSIDAKNTVCIGRARYLEERDPASGHVRYYTKVFYQKIDKQRYRTGPCITPIANMTNLMGRFFNFATFGHEDHHDTKRYDMVKVEYYDREQDDVILDCDEYLPKHWGHFICILDDRGLFGFGSGSMLFSRLMLFGVGSFALERQGVKILVFTDVRPYTELIYNTCSKHDAHF